MSPLISGDAPFANIDIQLPSTNHNQNAHFSSSISIHHIEKMFKSSLTKHSRNIADADITTASVG